jgi:diguanylate cyclase (GGDEF)-like protein
MSDTDLENAVPVAERIREAIAASRFEPLPHPVTASFGLVELTSGEQGSALLRRADTALYQAKSAGRNQVVRG